MEEFNVKDLLHRYERAFLLSQNLNNLDGSFAKAKITKETNDTIYIDLTYGVKDASGNVVSSITEKMTMDKGTYMVTIH